MKIYNCFLIISILLVYGCGYRSTRNTIAINEKMLINDLKIISHDSLEGRLAGSNGSKKVRKFLASKFDSLGIAPAFPSGSIQAFDHTFKGKQRHRIYPVNIEHPIPENIPDTTITLGNVVVKIKGKVESSIVITAHLDHLGIRDQEIYNGADDNASGVAALLTIADYFKDKSPHHTLIFAAVDAEEFGSVGAEYLLENFPGEQEKIVLNINMDMIAHNDSSELYAAGLYHYPFLKEPLYNIKSKIKLSFGHDEPDHEDMADWTYSSDHRIFHKENIPFIYFGVEDHEDYHKPSDTFESINPRFYIDAVKLIIQAIEAYDAFLIENTHLKP